MAATSPLLKAYPTVPNPVSKKSYCVAGVLTTVYGLDELPNDIEGVNCLWLLHPRLQDQTCMEPIAYSTINAWNTHLAATKRDQGAGMQGLIAVSFDQRNHGSRKIDDLANLDWRSGNERHAQDMFSIYQGTAADTSQLLDYLPSYVFPHGKRTITENIVCGVSLGGHASWLCLMQDPRITAAIIIIGCPDYMRLLSERAVLSKLPNAGPGFLGSSSFPEGLVEAVRRNDPAGQLLGFGSNREERFRRDPISDEKEAMLPLLHNSFRGKRILNMSGADDKLVPYSCSGPFLKWLHRAIAPSGWFSDLNLTLVDVCFDGVGHAMSPDMAKMLDQFVVETLQRSSANDGKSRL